MSEEIPAVGADTLPEGEEEWALVEVFGHRKHWGRVREVERFGAKMLRVDVPSLAAAPLLGEEEKFETFFYGGSAIFSFTPMTEEAARKWAESNRPRPMTPLNRLPPPEEQWQDPVRAGIHCERDKDYYDTESDHEEF